MIDSRNTSLDPEARRLLDEACAKAVAFAREYVIVDGRWVFKRSIWERAQTVRLTPPDVDDGKVR